MGFHSSTTQILFRGRSHRLTLRFALDLPPFSNRDVDKQNSCRVIGLSHANIYGGGGGGTRYRADTVERLLNVVYELPTDRDDLRHELVQLLTNNERRRSCSAAVVHW